MEAQLGLQLDREPAPAFKESDDGVVMLAGKYTLRNYQTKCVRDLRRSLALLKQKGSPMRVILVLPTGAGKTVVASYIMALSEKKQSRVLFLANARELIHQCARKLRECGVDPGIIMRGEKPMLWRLIQVASKGTLHSRGVRRGTMEMPNPVIIVVDECHGSMAKEWMQLLNSFGIDVVIIGLTATPARGDGQSLGEFYSDMVIGATYAELIAQGDLVSTRVFAPSQADLKGLKVSKATGDYSENQLAERMDQPKIIGDMFTWWRDHGGLDRKTILFGTNIKHSLHLRDMWLANGVPCAHIDGTMPTPERDQVLRDFATNKFRVIANCNVLTTGFDDPEVSCASLGRPTKSLVLYKQMVGRIMRPHTESGKVDALLFDHAGAVFEHGFPDEDVPWTLEAGVKIEDVMKKRREEGKAREPIKCPACTWVYYGAPQCPNCGYTPPARQGKPVAYAEGDPKEVNREEARLAAARVNRTATMEEKQKDWRRFVGEAIGKKKKIGYASHRYKEKYGVFPPNGLEPMPRGGTEWKMDAKEFWNRYHGKA